LNCGKKVGRNWKCKPTGPDGLKEFARILVFDTLLCYLYPQSTEPDQPFGDGTPIKTHRSRRACFPAIPVAPQPMMSFTEVLGIDDPNFSWSQLEFSTCKASAVRGVIDILGKPTQFVAAPYGLFLRVAEGIDSISNVILSSDSDLTGLDRAHALTCAMAQLGGILWSFVILWVSNPKSAHVTK
tara:strand:- start:190 stop:741 length:552 start_codon:yes stop_codon:yes gene_type:complete